ncbi:probable inactive poly [ADP-ribose] polymerase SRO5 isoform X2 [Salvia miltiorrhiza]|uniref:probable inactive poly [ADP-ribose] polymerase SRO5 isoform X2 n=1 Tax=Salvia miltiorrhiza TaxID=226208 RepID=UPI0025ABD734|nr:probable inactive poly [ADP-ribose] polymerase SRO5 isoform X2 [Salvia miltiorrhiza]
MCSEKYNEKLVSGSNHVSAERKSKKLTLFEDLLEDSHTVNSTSEINAVEDQYPSDCESGVSGCENEQQLLRNSGDGKARIGGGEEIHGIIAKKLVSSLSSSGFDARVERIHRIDFSSFTSRAKLQSFCIYSRAVEMKCNGDANVKYAWFGASKSEINAIISHGYCLPTSNGNHGYGVHLSPVDHPIQSLPLAAADEDGLMHMLLCRVIMGKMETVSLGSDQYNPSCEEFDSGVDDLASPRTYIIWSSRMNTHILPEYVVTFKASSCNREKQRNLQPPRVPNSDWMPFPTLIAALSKFLPRDAIESISKFHSDYRKQKVTRHEMIQRVRHIAGDKLLMTIIKSYRTKTKSGCNGVPRALRK